MDLQIYSGTANPALAADVAANLGLSLGQRILSQFSDGETHVQILESIRGDDIFILQSTCPPVNEHLMELLILIDAFHRAAAGQINVVIPYYGYSRQEKKSAGREPITARLVADLLTTAGADRVVCIDLHTPAIQGFFDIWMDHLTAVPLLASHLVAQPRPNAVVVAPDVGRAKMADRYAQALRVPLVVMHKRRPQPEVAEVKAVVGDVRGTSPIIVDDIVATGGTIAECVDALLDAGARPDIRVAVVHPLLTDGAVGKLQHPAISEVVVTDTVPVPPDRRWSGLTVLSVADLLAEAIRRLHEHRSLATLFEQVTPAYPV
jgi:ribose-phosphate pyrophosphokinase